MTTGIQVVIDCTDPARLAEFWALALGYTLQEPPAGFTTASLRGGGGRLTRRQGERRTSVKAATGRTTAGHGWDADRSGQEAVNITCALNGGTTVTWFAPDSATTRVC